MKRWYKALGLALVLVVGTTGVGSIGGTVHANSEIKDKLSDVQDKRAEKQEKAKETEEEIKKIKEEVQSLYEEIRVLDEEVETTRENIREKRVEIQDARERIEGLQAKIKELEDRIAERDELLKDRARSMYQSGGSINYLEVILGAKSFGDFLDRVNAATVIANQDKQIIEAHIEDQLQLEEAKKTVEEELDKLEENLEELETLNATLEEKRAEKDTVLSRLEDKESQLSSDLDGIEHEEEVLREQEAALKQELADYEEQQRAALQASTNGGSVSGQMHGTPEITNAGFMRPATGSITSTFGPRSSFGGRMHYGIDIGKNGRSGDVPIVAVQDGTVVTARSMNGYGNTVMIAHYIDGRLVTTLYAHMESLNVSNGQKVSKGQVIGIMGNTGRSFGAHLHFEVHEGGWNGAKSNAVNPLGYIPN